MIIPSIDIAGGEAVQLIGGKQQALTAGDPAPLADKFGRVGEVAVIDLDAALSRGSNAEQIGALLRNTRCRVGGGVRDVATAIRWLDAGAQKIILGTAATPEILAQLPPDRVIAALDALHPLSADAERGKQLAPQDAAPLSSVSSVPLRLKKQARGAQLTDGQVVDHGWTHKTGATVLERIEALRPYVSGFLITFVEREGRLTGIDLPTIRRYVDAAGEARVTIAGGIATAEEIAALDEIGADAQVGMALYTNRISLAECYCAMLQSDRPDALWPTIVVNESNQALGLAYSNLESVDRSLETGAAHYWSRRRGLWKKGESSGALQELLSIDADCDRDALRFTVRQTGRGFCHFEQTTCFGDLSGISELERRLTDRLASAPSGSYTRKLFESPQLLADKITEEAHELTAAIARDEVIHEAADVIFFTLARLVKENIAWSEVEQALDHRALKVTRR